MVIMGSFLNDFSFSPLMESRVWAIGNYGASIILILATLFLHTRLEMHIAALGLAIVLLSHLVLLSRERWDATHYLGLLYLILSTIFLILFVATRHTGVSYLTGAVLIFGAMALIIMELVAGWRTYKALDRMTSGKDEEPALEELEPYEKKVRLLAKKGETSFHREDCPLLQEVPVAELIQLDSRDEAIAYEMTPCKTCKP
jgi:hypothetical protein